MSRKSDRQTEARRGLRSLTRARPAERAGDRTPADSLLALQRGAGNAAVAGMIARRRAVREGVPGPRLQRITTVTFDASNAGAVQKPFYARTPPMRFSLTLPAGAHVTAHVLYVEEAERAVSFKGAEQAYAELLQLVKGITSRPLYLDAQKRDASSVAAVDKGIAALLGEYGGKALKDFDKMYWAQILAEIFDAYISFRASVPGGIASEMSGLKPLLASKHFIFNESKGVALMNSYESEVYEAFLPSSDMRVTARKRLLEGFAAGMAVTFDSVAAQKAGAGIVAMLAEHVKTCFDLHQLVGAAKERLQEFFLIYAGGEAYIDDVAKLTGVAASRTTSSLSTLVSVVDRKMVKKT